MASSEHPNFPTCSTGDREVYFAFTTKPGSLVLFENGTLTIITASGGEVNLGCTELLETLAAIKGHRQLGDLLHRLLS